MEDGGAGQIIPPPKNDSSPKDGFPGLCELRTTGGKGLEEAAAELHLQLLRLRRMPYVDFSAYDYKFSGAEMAYMRKNFRFEKDQIDVLNIYGKKPRALNGRTLASFQINISNLLHSEYKKNDVVIPATYGILDVYGIVSRLDKAFAADIKNSNRQPGMYCIKDDVRLEYRSLPNSAWRFQPDAERNVLAKIKKAVEGGDE